EGEIPVAADPDLARGEAQEMSGGKLLNTGQDGARIGHVAVAEVAGHAAQVEVAVDLGMGEQRTQLRSENEPAVAFRIVEGLLAHPVASCKERLAFGIPDHEGEHPVELSDTILAELLPGVNDHLGVGAGREPMASFAELSGQVAIVVDLAVDDGVHGARLVGDRLLPGGEIDDLQPTVTE